jgi:hypothetical protein
MSPVEIVIVLSARSLRSEGTRFGLHKAQQVEEVSRKAHAMGRLTDEMADEIFDAADSDIRKTVADIAAQVPPDKAAMFERAARAAYRRRMKELEHHERRNHPHDHHPGQG